MGTLTFTGSRYTTSQGGYKQLTWLVVISTKMESMGVSLPVRPPPVGGC